MRPPQLQRGTSVLSSTASTGYAGTLVQTVDILCHNGIQLARLLQLRQLPMRRIRLCIQVEQLVPVKTEKFRRMLFIKGVAQHHFGRVIILLVI